MGLSVLSLTICGFLIAGPHFSDASVLSVLLLWLLWAGVEFVIGFLRTFEGIEPSHVSIKIARMLWLLFVVYSWLDFRFGWTRIEPPSPVPLILSFFCIIGLLIRAWAVIHLGKSFTYDVRQPFEKVLVKTGPYRFIRHPGYLGICILATLPGMILGSVVGFAGMLLTTLVPVVLRIKAEDKLLEEEFGEDFVKYQSSTCSIIPFIY